MIDKKTQGKKNRAAGARFELKVRDDLEKKGWIVDKWSNNVEFIKEIDAIKSPKMANHYLQCQVDYLTKITKNAFRGNLVKVKNKFRGKGIPMMLGAGFPDFIAFKEKIRKNEIKIGFDIVGENLYENIGVEVKSNGYLKPEEKAKCKWLLKNNIFSKILIAQKGEKRGEIIYTEYSSTGDQEGKA